MKLELGTHKYELNEKISEYVTMKIGGLEKYVPRAARPTAHAKVTLSIDASGREGNDSICEVVLQVPKATLQVKEATSNIFASVDIAEAKLKSQLSKYKQKQAGKHTGLKRVLTRFRVQPDTE